MPGQLTQSIRPSGQGGDFTSLSSWESQNLDLVALDSASYAMIDGDWSGSVDSNQCYINGWTTSITNNVTIECIGTGSRHSGIWDDTKYKLEIEDQVIGCIRNGIPYVTIRGLQVRNYNPTGNGRSGITSEHQTGSVTIDSCIVRGTKSTIYRDSPIYAYSSLYNASAHISNCVVYDLQTFLNTYAGIYVRFAASSPSSSVVNCTVYGNNTGSWGYHLTVCPIKAVNCIAQNCEDGFYFGPGSPIQGFNNVSNVTEAANVNATTGNVLFVDSASYNFQLSPYDTLALGRGISQYTSSYSVTTDIAGTSRGNVSASYFDIGAFHSTQIIRTIKPSGQGGDYSSIVSWESGEQTNLIAVNKSATVYIDGDWTGASPDNGFRIAGWETDVNHQIYAIVTGSARHNGYYDPNKYVNTNLTYGNPIDLNVAFITIDGFQAKVTGSNTAYLEGIELDGNLNNCENIVKNCIVIDMHSGSGAGANTGIQFGFFTGNKKTGSLYNNIIIGFNRTHGNDSLVHTGIGNYGWPQRYVNNTIVDCYRPFYQNSGRTWVYNTIITGSEAVSYATLTGSHNLSNVDTFGTNQVYGRVQFVNPSNYDYRLSPYDTAVMSKGLNLYTSSFGVSITDDISGISRGNISASNFDIGASHSTKSIRTVKPSGQGGDYTSISSWESSEQTNLIAVNKSAIAYIDGDWSGSMDSPLTIAGWTSNISNSISIIVTGSARHNGYYDETKYVILGTPYVDSIRVPSTELAADCINIYGVQTKGPASNYRRGILFDVYSDYHTIDSCIISSPSSWGIQMNSGYTRVTNCTVINPDTIGIYIFGEDDYFFCCNNTVYSGSSGITLWYSNNNPIYNNICVGQSLASFYNPGPYSTIGTKVGNNISSDGTAWGNNSITSASVLFIDPTNYDFRLSPYDTTALGNGINLYTASFGLPISCNVTHDISGISRGNVSASYFDIGASHSTQSINTIKPSGQGGDYSSLSSWESGEQTNLVAVNKSVVAEITGDWSGSSNDSSTTISGWTTDISRSIIVQTDFNNAATATWSDTKYITNGIITPSDYVTLKGIQGRSTLAPMFGSGGGAATYYGIKYINLFARTTATGTTSQIYNLYSTQPMVAVNCIIMGTSASYVRGFGSQNSTHYLYNCSAYNVNYGCRRSNGTLRVVNFLYDSIKNNTYSSITTSTGSYSGLDTGIFVDGVNGNLNIANDDPNIVGAATDLSTDTLYGIYSFDYDINGNSRTGSWDIGVATFVSGPTPVPTVYVSARRMAGFFFP